MTSASDRIDLHGSRRGWLIICTLLLLVASTFRLVSLQDVPPGLAQDEVLNADIVGFIRGGENAFFFRHGYGHEPLYHYWSVPFQVLLGDNVLSIRLPAVFLGLLLVALTLRWVRRDFGRTAALVTGFGLAVSWWPVVFSRIGLRPIMEPVLLVAAVLLWPGTAALETNPRRAPLRAVAAGAVLGLSLYTYTAARVLFALPALYAVYALVMSWWVVRRPVGRPALTAGAYRQQAILAFGALATMALVALPLFLTLRADPSLQQRVDQLSGPLEALAAGQWQPIWATTTATLGVFGLTGDPRWTYALPNTPLFEPVAALLFLAGLSVALLRWRLPRYAFLMIWLVAALVPSAVTPDAPSSVRLVGAMPVIYLLPGLAVAVLWRWAQGREGAWVRPVVGVGLVAVAVLAAGRTVRDGFMTWPSALETRLKYQTVLLDISRDERLAASDSIAAKPPVVADGFFEPIDDATLRRDLGHDVAARWVQSGAEAGGALVWPLGGGRGSSLFVPEFAPLSAELLAHAGLAAQPIFRSTERPSYAVYALDEPPSPAGQPLIWTTAAGPAIELRQVDGPLEADKALLYTSWRVLSPLPEDLAIFVHLMDEEGQVVAQFDGFDAAAMTLSPEDVILQRHTLALPQSPVAGALTLQLGLYRRSDGTRLLTADGRDAITLTTCHFADRESPRSGLVCDLPELP